VLFAEWLAGLEGSHDHTTVDNYEMYVVAHFVPFFGALSGLTTASISDYTRARLRRVQAKTVRKEHSVLRGFIAWCCERGYLDERDPPIVHSVPKRATGTPDDKRRKVGGWIDLTEAEARAILRELPERGRLKRPVRAYFTVLWETGLRPETVVSLLAPHDYQPGAEHLVIRDEADKARYGRRLPLSPAARAALDSVCPEAGALFPRGRAGKAADYRHVLREAARRAGLDEKRAARISDYDFRHGRTTHLLAETGNLMGTAYLVGHKNVTTTNNYAHARQAHAELALAQVQQGGARKRRKRG
jgi:integrase